MATEKEIVTEAVKQLRSTSSESQQKLILGNAVSKLRGNGLTSNRIIDMFDVEIKEQDNSVMMSNNATYLALLSQILKG